MRRRLNMIPTNKIIDSVFNRSISDIMGSDFVTTQPSVNIVELNDAYNIEVAAPGLSKNDFDIKIEKDQLIISGTKTSKKEEPIEGKTTRREFDYSTFKRSFLLDKTIDVESIKANYKSGVLSIKLSKKEEAIDNGPIHIDIK
jgi:HSP20 family protein